MKKYLIIVVAAGFSGISMGSPSLPKVGKAMLKSALGVTPSSMTFINQTTVPNYGTPAGAINIVFYATQPSASNWSGFSKVVQVQNSANQTPAPLAVPFDQDMNYYCINQSSAPGAGCDLGPFVSIDQTTCTVNVMSSQYGNYIVGCQLAS